MLYNPIAYKIFGYTVLTLLFPIVLPVRVYEKLTGKQYTY